MPFVKTNNIDIAYETFGKNSNRPLGFMRQYAALLAAESRQAALGSLSMPTLVIHGSHDPLVILAHGLDTAESIPGAKLLVVEGLGHGLTYPRLWDSMVAAISEHTTGASAEKAERNGSY